MRIPLAAPDLGDAEIESVAAVLRTPWLSLGPRLPAFEDGFARRTGAAHAVAVSSGTAGLHLCVRASGLGSGDEVITTPFSFVASTNALLYERVRPVFVDVDPVTLNLDPARIAEAVTPRTRGILAVHVFGRAAAMPEILGIARRRGLVVIEDACEALGAELGGRSAGCFGDCGVFGFYPNKQITTGEGGMIVTDSPELARLFRSLRNQGRDDEESGYARLGYNYRLGELACALGSAQLERLGALSARREAVARGYHERLRERGDLVLPGLEVEGGRIGWFAYVVRLAEGFDVEDRDWIVAELRRRGIGSGRYFPPIHLQPHVREVVRHRRGDFPVTEAAAARSLALPFFTGITDAQLDEVCSTLVGLVEQRSLA
jgi:perosamine synthetase